MVKVFCDTCGDEMEHNCVWFRWGDSEAASVSAYDARVGRHRWEGLADKQAQLCETCSDAVINRIKGKA